MLRFAAVIALLLITVLAQNSNPAGNITGSLETSADGASRCLRRLDLWLLLQLEVLVFNNAITPYV